jgi:hypothetical protein
MGNRIDLKSVPANETRGLSVLVGPQLRASFRTAFCILARPLSRFVSIAVTCPLGIIVVADVFPWNRNVLY